MFWLKSCPKCDSGDLYDSQDQYGRYIACLQCGHHLNEVEEALLGYIARTVRVRPPHAQSRRADEASVAGKSLAGVA